MPRHLVCITFDFDALSPWIARGLATPSVLSRGEFGIVGAARLLELLAARDIRSTWFIPGHTLESFPAICARVHQAGHEVGHHGWTHVAPSLMTRAEEEAELVRANEAIRKLTGRTARGYRSPSWDLSPHSVELLLAHGFRYDSSMMGHDYSPYRVRSADVIELKAPAVFGAPTKLIEIPISWSLDDYPHFEHVRLPNMIQTGLMNARDVFENWFDDFRYLTRLDWGVITYTFHPFVIGRGHRLLQLERLLDRLADAGAIFTTMEAVAEEFERR